MIDVSLDPTIPAHVGKPLAVLPFHPWLRIIPTLLGKTARLSPCLTVRSDQPHARVIPFNVCAVRFGHIDRSRLSEW